MSEKVAHVVAGPVDLKAWKHEDGKVQFTMHYNGEQRIDMGEEAAKLFANFVRLTMEHQGRPITWPS